MRNRHSKHTTTTKCLEMKQQQREPHLSGAYIRSLVKQLSSSRPKESPPLTNTPNSDHPQFNHHSPPPPPPPTQPPKKQVRRRLHTSRPYQERLLNMAEARREIVTALKFHRASMTQARQEQQLQTPIPPLISPPPNPNPNCSYQPCQSFCWAYPPIVPIPMNDALAFPLPNQPLGLNLNFQGFYNIEIPIPLSNNEQIPASSVSASSSSSSVESSVEVTPPMVAEDPNGPTLHPVMDAKDMREIRSLSEQHDMEWNDTMNLVTTAWWSKVLDGGGERKSFFDEAASVPAWLTDGAGGTPAMSWELPQYFEGCLQEEKLPCLDVEGIDGLNMDWIS